MGSLAWGTKRVKRAATLFMALLVVLSFSGNADKIGQEYTETGFKRALITLASAPDTNGLKVLRMSSWNSGDAGL